MMFICSIELSSYHWSTSFFFRYTIGVHLGSAFAILHVQNISYNIMKILNSKSPQKYIVNFKWTTSLLFYARTYHPISQNLFCMIYSTLIF